MRWIKNNWKGLLILVGGIAAVAVLTVVILTQREDRGFLVRECIRGEGMNKPIRWAKGSVPIPIRIMEDSAKWSAPLEKAFFFWTKNVGDVFRAGEPIKALEEPSDPVIIFEVISNGSFDEAHPGKTKLFWNGNCEVRRAHVTVDGLVTSEKLQEVIARHELGHALGLDHDTYEDSVMYPGGKPMRWGMDKVLDADRKLLTETYGTTTSTQ